MPLFAFFIVTILLSINAFSNELLYKSYENYDLWLDCDKRAAIAFKYEVKADTGNKKRYSSFYDDLSTPQSCEQLSRDTYVHHINNAPKYDRGHLAAANHFDFDKSALKEANYMTNVLPQTVKLNRGAWKRTEELIECYRDSFNVFTIGGVVWGTDSSNDHFKISHGIETPDYYWRVLLGTKDNKHYFSSWILPNDTSASSANLKHFEVTFLQLIEHVSYEEIRKELNSLPIKSGESFQYYKGCKAYES